MTSRSKKRNSEKGAAAVEFALVVPLLLSLLFGIIEFGWAYGQLLDVRHGAREGARLISVNDFPAGQSADDTTAAEQSTHLVTTICERMDLTNDAEITLAFENSAAISAGGTVLITVAAPLQTITGWFDPMIGSKTLTSSLEVRLEQEATWNEVADVSCASVLP